MPRAGSHSPEPGSRPWRASGRWPIGYAQPALVSRWNWRQKNSLNLVGDVKMSGVRGKPGTLGSSAEAELVERILVAAVATAGTGLYVVHHLRPGRVGNRQTPGVIAGLGGGDRVG